MNDILRIARLKIALQRAFLGRAILRVIGQKTMLKKFIIKGTVNHCEFDERTRIMQNVVEKFQVTKIKGFMSISAKQPTAPSHFRRLIKAKGTLHYIAPSSLDTRQ